MSDWLLESLFEGFMFSLVDGLVDWWLILFLFDRMIHYWARCVFDSLSASFINCVIGWMICLVDWLIDRLIVWLICWLVACLLLRLIHWSITWLLGRNHVLLGWLIHCSFDQVNACFIVYLVDWLCDWIVAFLIVNLIAWLIDYLIGCVSSW